VPILNAKIWRFFRFRINQSFISFYRQSQGPVQVRPTYWRTEEENLFLRGENAVTELDYSTVGSECPETGVGKAFRRVVRPQGDDGSINLRRSRRAGTLTPEDHLDGISSLRSRQRARCIRESDQLGSGNVHDYTSSA